MNRKPLPAPPRSASPLASPPLPASPLPLPSSLASPPLQAHAPVSDISIPLMLPALVKLHDERPEDEATGLMGVELPEARM